MPAIRPIRVQRDQRGLYRPVAAVRDLLHTFAGSSPSRLALMVFAAVVLFFTALLSLPAAANDGRVTPLHDAMFTAASATTVTGLVTVNTAEHWSFFGQLVILVAIQVGGLGILTIASLLAVAVNRRLGVRGKLLAQEGMNTGRLGEVGNLLRVVALTTLAIEGAIAAVLVPRFIMLEDDFLGGLWHGIFYSISAFNNAGFLSHVNGIVEWQNDPWIIYPIMVGVFVGSLGFPVIMVLLATKWRVKSWNLHTKLTLETSVILLVLGAVGWAAFEWNNPDTIGDVSDAEKLQHSLFASIMTRSGGFNLVDMNDATSTTLLLTDALMFAGGGSASTAGGIKVTTIAVMFLAIVAEARGDADVKVHGRTIPPGAMRVAISVLAMGATLVLVSSAAIMAISGETLERVLFEVLSAFATCGLSVGLSAELPPEGKYVLSALMFAGRVGTITLAAALALRQNRQLFRYPEERPIIG